MKHLEGLRSEGAGSPDRFRAGYRHCVTEVSKFQGIEPTLRRRLVRHLEGCVNTPGARPAGAPTPPSDVEDAPQGQHSTIFISGELDYTFATLPKNSLQSFQCSLMDFSRGPIYYICLVFLGIFF